MNNEEIIQKNYLEWTQFPFDKETILEVKKLKNDNHSKFHDSFYKDLSFGTGGMRGIVGYGPNRVNKYTFGKCTYGSTFSAFVRKDNFFGVQFHPEKSSKNGSKFLMQFLKQL